MRNKLVKTWHFLGSKVTTLLILDFVFGVLWFGIESGFLIVFQGFLLALQIADLGTLRLPSWYPQGLEINLLIFALYGLIRAALIGAKRIVPALAAENFAANQRNKILKKSLQYGQKSTTSEVLATFGDLTTKAGYCVQHGSIALTSFTIILLLFILSLRLAWVETILSITLLVSVMYPLRRFNKKIRKEGEGLVKEWGKANKLLGDSLKNIFLLRVYSLVEKELKKGMDKIESYGVHYSRYLYASGFIASVPVFFGLLIIAIVAFISKKYLTTDPFHFLAFLYLFLRTAQIASQMNTAITNVLFFQQPFLHLYRWTSDFKEEPLQENHVLPSKIDNQPITIQLSDVSFGYVPNQNILKNLNLSIGSGEFLLLKGPSGVGKSTIIKLMAGMEMPDSGQVQVGDLSPRDFVSMHSSSIGYVGPDPLLIAGTVRENLLYGNLQNVADEDIWISLEELGLLDVIRSFENGLNEILHEDTQLSTGQKQRLSFARAILRKPVFLILDEATANIDYDTESLIVNYLRRFKNKVTVVAISHRDSFDEVADKKVILG